MILDYQNGSEDCAVFSNLFSKEPYPKTLDKYMDYLKSISITLPKQMIDAVLRDAFRRSEDCEVTHSISSNDGSYTRFESIDYAIL